MQISVGRTALCNLYTITTKKHENIVHVSKRGRTSHINMNLTVVHAEYIGYFLKEFPM